MQRQVEATTACGIVLNPNATAVAFNDACHDCQSDAAASRRQFPAVLQPSEESEGPLALVGRNADTVVCYPALDHRVHQPCAYLDFRPLFGPHVLDGIV